MLRLPKENLVYSSILNAQQIQERLSTYVEPRLDSFIDWKKKREKPYEGIVDRESFEITRVINYRNSFLPLISGKVKRTESQTLILVTMTLPLFVRVFITIYCSMALLFFISYVVISIRQNLIYPGILVPVGLLVFMYYLTNKGFKGESKKAKDDLKQMLLANVISNHR